MSISIRRLIATQSHKGEESHYPFVLNFIEWQQIFFRAGPFLKRKVSEPLFGKKRGRGDFARLRSL
jgi:hypothetical protein